ncbi:HAD domain-containing protein [Kineosporia succinea]|uniref:Secreted protein n=1 Tax=Kineosporia succinea TaxID=84632 RepID=A0ABT9PD38_9ACTN|nr:hypothetical protein [Kineosporia succinea]MDP9830618.1 hypothetical protein [Kineosporia succinea]
MRAPVWLLDLDGVINGSRPGWGRSPRSTSLEANGCEYRIRYAPALMIRIRTLHRAGRVELRWASTWAGHTFELNDLFSLPGVPPAFALPHGDGTPREQVGELKVHAALAVVRAGGRLIWTDDEAIPPAGAVREELEAAGALLIAPDATRCLRPDDLDVIENYAVG